MTRFKIGIGFLTLVAAVLVIAPTVVFWYIFGPGAVVAHWAGVGALLFLSLLGVLLIFTGRPKKGRPDTGAPEGRLRFQLGITAFVIVAAVLVFAPTIVFWEIFGIEAVVAHWAAVFGLGLLTFGGLYLIFSDKGHSRERA